MYGPEPSRRRLHPRVRAAAGKDVIPLWSALRTGERCSLSLRLPQRLCPSKGVLPAPSPAPADAAVCAAAGGYGRPSTYLLR
jgi:hypothetical protein